MRVVYVLTIDSGGPVSHVLDLAPRVASRGVDVSVICASAAEAAEFDRRGVSAEAVAVRDKFDVRGAARLARSLPEADVIHTHDRRAGLFARVAGRLRGSAVVHTYHGLPEEIAVEVGREVAPGKPAPSGSAVRRWWLRNGYLRIEAVLATLGIVVVPSHAMRDYLASRGLPQAKLRVVPSGIDVTRSGTPPRHSPFRIAIAANLEHWKGIDVALDACATARATVDLRLDVYGDGSLRRDLERQATRLGVPATFHGQVRDARVRLADADLVVLPSRAENLPITILEAMAAAVPVVATRVGGVPELVEEGVTGRVVAPDDADAMAAAIVGFALDEGRRVAAGEAGAGRVAARFDATSIAGRLVDVYEEACASSR